MNISLYVPFCLVGLWDLINVALVLILYGRLIDVVGFWSWPITQNKITCYESASNECSNKVRVQMQLMSVRVQALSHFRRFPNLKFMSAWVSAVRMATEYFGVQLIIPEIRGDSSKMNKDQWSKSVGQRSRIKSVWLKSSLKLELCNTGCIRNRGFLIM